jgi:hypothetical protein
MSHDSLSAIWTTREANGITLIPRPKTSEPGAEVCLVQVLESKNQRTWSSDVQGTDYCLSSTRSRREREGERKRECMQIHLSSGFFFYLGPHLIGWSPLTLGNNGFSLFSAVIQIPISSGNTLIYIPRNNALSVICVPLSPVQLIPTINHQLPTEHLIVSMLILPFPPLCEISPI